MGLNSDSNVVNSHHVDLAFLRGSQENSFFRKLKNMVRMTLSSLNMLIPETLEIRGLLKLRNLIKESFLEVHFYRLFDHISMVHLCNFSSTKISKRLMSPTDTNNLGL